MAPIWNKGKPIPSWELFQEISFPDPFTFCGSICWQEDYGTTRQGRTQWKYEMNFDLSFYCIMSGHVQHLLTSRLERDMILLW